MMPMLRVSEFGLYLAFEVGLGKIPSRNRYWLFRMQLEVLY